MTIEREGIDSEAIQATIVHIHVVGRSVQVELKRLDNDQFLEAELTKERYRELNLKAGESVFVKPNQLRVFIPEDYSI